jgi:hypothetical protein
LQNKRLNALIRRHSFKLYEKVMNSTGDVGMWGCGDVKMWRCEDVRM